MPQLTTSDLTNLRTLLSWVPDDKLNAHWLSERDELIAKLGEIRNATESAPNEFLPRVPGPRVKVPTKKIPRR